MDMQKFGGGYGYSIFSVKPLRTASFLEIITKDGPMNSGTVEALPITVPYRAADCVGISSWKKRDLHALTPYYLVWLLPLREFPEVSGRRILGAAARGGAGTRCSNFH
jgi:hypothetical protein